MKIFLLILIIALIILFCPIPLKLKLKYIDKKLEIFIYNKKLSLEKSKNTSKKNINKTKKKQSTSKKKLPSINIKGLISDIIYNKYKFNIKIKTKVNYSFPDAAQTAILYGYMHQGFAIVQMLLKLIFNVKDFKYDINFQFNKNYINVETEGIFFISFAKVIYICFLALKNIKKKDKIKISQPI